MLSIEVCYALPDRQTLIPVSLPEGATVRAAIDASGVLALHPEIDLAQAKPACSASSHRSTRRSPTTTVSRSTGR